jgi:fermentation-respiration switch protein FrsA (DUF1100 family)
MGVVGAVSGTTAVRLLRPPRGQPWSASVGEPVAFRARDGLRIAGRFFPHAEPAAAVVICHGFWSHSYALLGGAQALHAAGYAVLLFDFRAHGLSDGRLSSIGHHETNDLLGAVDYLLTRPEVLPDRVAVLGYSMGGAVALLAAAQHPGIRAVIADSAYASLGRALRRGLQLSCRLPSFPFRIVTLRLGERLLGIQADTVTTVQAIAAIAPRPVFLIHGAVDDLIPVSDAETLFAAAGEPKQLWIVPNAGHAAAYLVATEEYGRRVLAFLRRYL